jgi:hypothetical protein
VGLAMAAKEFCVAQACCGSRNKLKEGEEKKGRSLEAMRGDKGIYYYYYYYLLPRGLL